MPVHIRTYKRGSTTNKTLGTMLAKGMVRCCSSQVRSRPPETRKLAHSRRHGWVFKKEYCLPSTRNCTRSCFRHGVLLPCTTSLQGSPRLRMHETVVSIPLQCPVRWLGDGDTVVIGQHAARFERNTDPSKLDEYGFCTLNKAIPLEMLDRVVAEVDTFPMDQWDPIFQHYSVVHRGPNPSDQRISGHMKGDDRHR